MNTIKLDKNFSNNCDELMKDLQKPTTQTEEIVWHKYPDEKPSDVRDYLLHIEEQPQIFAVITASPFYGDWRTDGYEGDIIPSGQVIAWAELPKGWIEE